MRFNSVLIYCFRQLNSSSVTISYMYVIFFSQLWDATTRSIGSSLGVPSIFFFLPSSLFLFPISLPFPFIYLFLSAFSFIYRIQISHIFLTSQNSTLTTHSFARDVLTCFDMAHSRFQLWVSGYFEIRSETGMKNNNTININM